MYLRFISVNSWSFGGFSFDHLAVYTHIIFPATAHQQILLYAKQRFSWGFSGLQTLKPAEGPKWTNRLADCLQVSLYIFFSKGRNLFVSFVVGNVSLLWSKFQLQFLCFKLLSSDFSLTAFYQFDTL